MDVFNFSDSVVPTGTRSLQDTPGLLVAADPTIVRTAQELVQALWRPDRHIEIRSHLDLTSITPFNLAERVMLDAWPPTWSIRVRISKRLHHDL